MQLCWIRAGYGVLVLALMGAIAGVRWNNSVHEKISIPGMPHFVMFVNSPQRVARPLPDGHSIPPDARPFEFNGRTYYIVPLS